MTVKITTALRNNLLGKRAEVQNIVSGSNIAFTANSITDEDSGLGDFSPGDKLTTLTSSGVNGGTTATILTVAAGTLTFDDATFTAEAKGTCGAVVLASARGGSYVDIFRHGRLVVYSGTFPSDVDAAITGTALCEYSKSAGEFTPGSDDNGLNFGTAAGGVLAKDTTETWQGVGKTAAGAGVQGNYWVLYDNTATPSTLGTVANKMIGLVGTSGASFTSGIVTWVSGTTYTMQTAEIPMPAS
jgi:hypothetical protein